MQGRLGAESLGGYGALVMLLWFKWNRALLTLSFHPATSLLSTSLPRLLVSHNVRIFCALRTTCRPRPHHTLQPLLQDPAVVRAPPTPNHRRPTRSQEGRLVGQQERAASTPAAAAGGDDPRRAAEDGGAGPEGGMNCVGRFV